MVRRYRVEVYSRGVFVSHHTIEADDALTAINLVEAQFGQPPKVEETTVYFDDGKKEHLLIVSDWHGYSFEARQLLPVAA
ncbi:MAG: hypothetical protein HC875_22240 [Anaerolineales bacterium]|nr:hypothetical protein [Anaerolineales bacterium]